MDCLSSLPDLHLSQKIGYLEKKGVFTLAHHAALVALITLVTYSCFAPMSVEVVGGSVIALSAGACLFQHLQKRPAEGCLGGEVRHNVYRWIDAISMLALSALATLLFMQHITPPILFWSSFSIISAGALAKLISDQWPAHVEPFVVSGIA